MASVTEEAIFVKFGLSKGKFTEAWTTPNRKIVGEKVKNRKIVLFSFLFHLLHKLVIVRFDMLHGVWLL